MAKNTEWRAEIRSFSSLYNIILAVIIVIILTTAEGRPTRKNARCVTVHKCDTRCSEEPSRESLEQKLSSSTDLHMSFYQFPPLQRMALTLEKFEKRHEDQNVSVVNILYSYIDAERPKCEGMPDTPSAPWDPCPRIWRFNHDDNRIPRTLVEAECLQCDHCKSLAPPGFQLEDRPKTPGKQLMCSPVKVHTKVLRRACGCDGKSGEYLYEAVWEPVTIGCTCKRADEEQKASPSCRIFSPKH